MGLEVSIESRQCNLQLSLRWFAVLKLRELQDAVDAPIVLYPYHIQAGTSCSRTERQKTKHV